MTEQGEALWERLEESRREAIVSRIHAATALREAVRVFNSQPITPAAIDEIRDRILGVADGLAPLDTNYRDLAVAAAREEFGHSVRVA